MAGLTYRNAMAITFARHGAMRLRAPLDYGFARKVEAVPLGLGEIPLAAQHYPVVFTDEPAPRPVAVLSLRPGENLFVDEKGQWLEGAYVPAVVRRYPFGLAPVGEQGEPVLCVDTIAEVLTDEGGLPLYDGLKPGKLLRKAIQLCQAVAVDEAAAADLTGRLRELDLLDARAARAQIPKSGLQLGLSGFLTIDEARLRALDDDIFLGLRRAGWLNAVYAQMNSVLNWHRLADHTHARQAA